MPSEYYKTKESVQEYIRLARDVNGDQLIKKLKKYLPAGSSMLEIGSGPGTDWKILMEDYQVTGSDNSCEFLGYLKSSNPDGKFVELDAVSLDIADKFDCIYSNKVMHHLNDRELGVSISRQKAILSKGGVICHSFWAGEGSENFKGLFVNYHTRKTLHEYFSRDFEILLIESYREFEEDDSLLLIGRKREK